MKNSKKFGSDTQTVRGISADKLMLFNALLASLLKFCRDMEADADCCTEGHDEMAFALRYGSNQSVGSVEYPLTTEKKSTQQ